MNNKYKYCDIYEYRLKELTDNIDTKSANAGGTARAMIVLIPVSC